MGAPLATYLAASATRGSEERHSKFSQMRLQKAGWQGRFASKCRAGPRKAVDLRRRWGATSGQTKSGSSAQWDPRYRQKVAFSGTGFRQPGLPKTLEQSEDHLDRHLSRNALPVRSNRRPELPLPHSFNRLLIESQAGALSNLNVRRASVQRDDNHQDDHTLVFRFARFVRILRIGAIDAGRHAHAVYPCAKRASASAAAFTRAKAAA